MEQGGTEAGATRSSVTQSIAEFVQQRAAEGGAGVVDIVTGGTASSGTRSGPRLPDGPDTEGAPEPPLPDIQQDPYSSPLYRNATKPGRETETRAGSSYRSRRLDSPCGCRQERTSEIVHRHDLPVRRKAPPDDHKPTAKRSRSGCRHAITPPRNSRGTDPARALRLSACGTAPPGRPFRGGRDRIRPG